MRILPNSIFQVDIASALSSTSRPPYTNQRLFGQLEIDSLKNVVEKRLSALGLDKITEVTTLKDETTSLLVTLSNPNKQIPANYYDSGCFYVEIGNLDDNQKSRANSFFFRADGNIDPLFNDPNGVNGFTLATEMTFDQAMQYFETFLNNNAALFAEWEREAVLQRLYALGPSEFLTPAESSRVLQGTSSVNNYTFSTGYLPWDEHVRLIENQQAALFHTSQGDFDIRPIQA